MLWTDRPDQAASFPSSSVPTLLNPIDKLHLGLDERQQMRRVQLAPTRFGHHQQLIRHDQPFRA